MLQRVLLLEIGTFKSFRICPSFLRWSGTESTITDATTGLMYKPWMMDNDECGAVSGMFDRWHRGTWRKPAQCRFAHHKSHMTFPGLEPGLPQWEAGD
jgi:hypothetical protein